MQHLENSFKGYQGFKIYYQYWLPDGEAKAVLLISHGYAEHSGRYGNVVNYFVPRGYAVYAPDHRGHGRSDGARVEVDDFHDYVVDLKTFFDIVKKKNPDKKVFLIGHSMGSVIAVAYALEYQHELAGMLNSSGGLLKPGDPPMTPPSAGKPLSAFILSRDPAVVEAYKNDPLVYHGPMPLKHSMRTMMSTLAEQAGDIKLPVLVMAGTGGSDGSRCQNLYDILGSQDKTLKLYPGLMHEIFNEPEHLQVMADMENFIVAHNS
jgi:acylglycerol lipase